MEQKILLISAISNITKYLDTYSYINRLSSVTTLEYYNATTLALFPCNFFLVSWYYGSVALKCKEILHFEV